MRNKAADVPKRIAPRLKRVADANIAPGGKDMVQPKTLTTKRRQDGTMTTKQKNTFRGKPTGVKESRSSSDHDFTCSEAQLDNLLSEGESTGQTGIAASRGSSNRDVAGRRKPK